MYYLTLGVGASTSDSISVMCHCQCHWYHVMQIPMASQSHNQKFMLYLNTIVLT